MADFRWAEVVVQNPAVPRDSPFLAQARRRGVRIENEATLFFSQVARDRIIGITGTRGKSTTAALTAALLRKKFPQTILAGNIATTPMMAVVNRARRSRAPVVLELSSWHLENLGQQGLSPHVAVVTNILPDHADRYPGFGAYVTAKRHMVAHQTSADVAVLNWDNSLTRRLCGQTHARCVAFSLRAMKRPPSVFVDGGVVWLQDGQRRQRIFAAAHRNIAGQHNLANILAATAVAVYYDLSRASIAAGVAEFCGLPYRQEVVANNGGVTWVNDSTATTPEATMAALLTLPTRPRSIILIAGGSDKKLPDASFLALGRAIFGACKLAVLLAGPGSERILRHLPLYAGLPVVSGLTSMVSAVKIAQTAAVSGDIVLLSPACASFGLFVHEFDRGDQFNQCVKDCT